MTRVLYALLFMVSIHNCSSLEIVKGHRSAKIAVLDWGLLERDAENKSIIQIESVDQSKFVAGFAPNHHHGSLVIQIISSYKSNEVPNPMNFIYNKSFPNEAPISNDDLYGKYLPSIFFYGICDNGVSPELNDITENSVKAIEMAIDSEADIINLSYGRDDSFSVSEYMALKKASDAGIIIIAAAGNDGKELDENTQYFPCNVKVDNMICVGAMKNGEIANYSNYGSSVSVFADGSSGSGDNGTSFATPRIARAAAFAIQNSKLNPSEIIDLIKNSTISFVYSDGKIANKFSEELFNNALLK